MNVLSLEKQRKSSFPLVFSSLLRTFACTMERMHTKEEKLEAFGRLLDVMDRLREECPWDRKQTNDSLRANTIEETYELCEALINDNQHEICKELGDVLLHIVFYGRIGEEKQHLTLPTYAISCATN